MRVRAGLVVLALSAACSGPSQDDGEHKPVPRSPQPTPVATGMAPRATPSATPTARPTPTFDVRVVPVKKGAFVYEAFLSPSHNISCAVGQDEQEGGFARCDIAEHIWPLPPREPHCDLDWGSVATINSSWKRGKMGACVSDAAGGEKVMPYGHALRVADVECRSETRGVTCVVRGTGHGFFVSKASYRLF